MANDNKKRGIGVPRHDGNDSLVGAQAVFIYLVTHVRFAGRDVEIGGDVHVMSSTGIRPVSPLLSSEGKDLGPKRRVCQAKLSCQARLEVPARNSNSDC